MAEWVCFVAKILIFLIWDCFDQINIFSHRANFSTLTTADFPSLKLMKPIFVLGFYNTILSSALNFWL